MHLRGVVLAVVGAAAVLSFASVPGFAAEKEAGAPPKAPIVGGSPSAVPDAFKLNMLIRTTLIALSQANQTGNYSVLRDLGTPQFQAMNTDARLAEIFAGLRSRNLDLSPVIFFDPKLVREPAIQPGGLLRLTGFIPTEPQRILFDLGFESVADQWRLSAIVIDVQPAPVGASAAPTGQTTSATTSKGTPAKQTDRSAPKP